MLPDPIDALGGFVAQVVTAKVTAEKQHEWHSVAIGSLKLVDLGGYFGSDYLGYEAAEGIDWVWEHRIDDLVKLGL